jgi:hypothetical protein
MQYTSRFPGRTGRRTTAVAVAVMMASMVALPGAAQASASRANASVAQTAPAAASHAVSTFALRSSTFQGDCGWVTCTLRLNRAATRNARDAGWLIAAAAGACGVVTSGAGAVVCGAAIAPAAVTLAVFAGRYYEDGDCLGIKFTHPPVPSVAWPSRVKHGSYNCS